ncbi:MAG: ATP synthase F1 subunit epsilon [bacterium]
MIKLQIITPKKLVREEEISSITLPAHDGEITVLPNHQPLLSLLIEGIVTMRHGSREESLAIGGGYIETNGRTMKLLVSRAYGQDEIDEKLTLEAIERAKTLIAESSDPANKAEAESLMRRSIIDSRLIKRHKSRSVSTL